MGFKTLGLDVTGIDRSHCAKSDVDSTVPIHVLDLEKDKLPFPDQSFDFVFCKSVIEHINHPEAVLLEIRRILKKNGRLAILTPDWESNYKWFYDDYTHVRPYTVKSLSDLLRALGFNEVKVSKFFQIPFLWKAPFLKFIPLLLRRLPDGFKKVKLIFFSKEIMLLAEASK